MGTRLPDYQRQRQLSAVETGERTLTVGKVQKTLQPCTRATRDLQLTMTKLDKECPVVTAQAESTPAMLLDEVNELICCSGHGNAPPHHLLAHIQVNLAGCPANVPKVCRTAYCNTWSVTGPAVIVIMICLLGAMGSSGTIMWTG